MVSRVKVLYLKAVICTSLIWFLIDVFVIEYFTDCKYKEDTKEPEAIYKFTSDGYIPTENLKPFSREEHIIHTNEDGSENKTPSPSAKADKSKAIDDSKAMSVDKEASKHRDAKKSKSDVMQKPNPKDPGENGTGVVIPEEQQAEKEKLFTIHMFNLMASEKISLDRSLPEVRSPKCIEKAKIYPGVDKLPTTSIVIVFHNEAWTTLLRTVHSAINRSPRELLLEIILVDDASTLEHLGKKLDDHVAKLPVSVHVLRMKHRTGAIEGRIRGADIAEAETLTFLDSHCECAEGWLEPLLYEVYKDRTAVASPVIDIINFNTFEYVKAVSMFGGFEWDLSFNWFPVPEREMKRTGNDETAPIRSPTIAGGLFSINKTFFYEIGTFDKGMDTWGAENLDISWRTWLCHGTLLIAPCSCVGHVFREKRYFKFPKGARWSLNKNNARLAEVWMDEWKLYYYKMTPDAIGMDYGNITQRLKVKRDVKCKSFKWYLENVFPEMIMPLDYTFLGKVQNNVTNQCLHHGSTTTDDLGIGKCFDIDFLKVFCFTKENTLLSNSKCLEYNIHGKELSFEDCRKGSISQIWIYNRQTLQIMHSQSKLCLDSNAKKPDKEKPIISPCYRKKPTQKWNLIDE